MSGTSPRPDAPRLPVLFAIAAVGLVAGFGVARASLDVDRAALASRTEGTPDSPAPEEAPAPADTPSSDETQEEPAVDAGVDVDVVAPPDAASPSLEAALPEPTAGSDSDAPEEAVEPAVDAPVTAGTSGRIVVGRVAYIRCEGVPGGACPRDLTIERRAWEAIRALDRCAGLAGRTGEADVRVVFDGPRMSGLGFRDLGPGGLDREAIRACLEPRLGELRSGTGASRMTVAFAFSLER